MTAQARRVLETLALPGLTLFEGDVGAAAYRRHGHPLPPRNARDGACRRCGAVRRGGRFFRDDLPRALRPEQAILGLRSELACSPTCARGGLPGLEHLSSLKPDVARSIDLLVVRELNGDVYFGDKGERDSTGGREGGTRCPITRPRCADRAHRARAAMGRGKRLTSVDKANVLETSRIWRETVIEVGEGISRGRA